LIRDLERVLAPDGWSYASALPVDASDPGRFNALFGRDSLITALQVLPERPDVTRATLRAHAELQGRVVDPLLDEEPGKIVHEYRPEPDERFIPAEWNALVRDGRLRYYGSADSTPWFLVVLGALGDRGLAAELEDSWRAAGDWLLASLVRGGGLVRWGPRSEPGGLSQQGWRDTIDPHHESGYGGGILHADGAVPQPPVADADTQAVAVAALRALARLTGDERFGHEAAELRGRIADAFDAETMAVDAEGRRVEGAGSQLGWLLWAAALPDPDPFAERLGRPDVLTDFGLRTLSSDHPQFSPTAYHRGSVWPFDSWLGWGGLRAAGREAEAERVRTGVLEALDRLGNAPELYAVTEAGPERVPIANQIQAWTVGARWALENGWDGRVA
jgi:glycogen debranching enzyme